MPFFLLDYLSKKKQNQIYYTRDLIEPRGLSFHNVAYARYGVPSKMFRTEYTFWDVLACSLVRAD
jgi:hypothetical protein